ncbi:MAG: isocitrate lyase/phosphoenolpyruvate mutase family protein [Alphaproteobacteria bacterium]|nr:isocitrate lyase/phosphoenolpyruvate mutase family protein [Alphaproteobacteria bacterium]
MTSPGASLRASLRDQPPVVAPGVFDGLSAHLARRAGFAAVYASGGAIARSMGLPDLGLAGMAEVAGRLHEIVEAADCPVLADGDTGHGTALHVRRTVQTFERVGLAGLHIEDQGFPKRCGHIEGKKLIPVAEMAGKIAAAVAARRDPDFVIVARTDAIAVEGFGAAMDRARAYRDAGADLLFVEAAEDKAQVAEIPRRLGCPTMINMFRGGRTPFLPARQLGKMGYSLVIVASDLQRAVIRAMTDVLAAIREDGDSGAVADMLSPLPARDEAVGHDDWLAWAERFGG